MPIVSVSAGRASGPTATDAEYFHVEYYCPRQAPNWQRGRRPVLGYGAACDLARSLKPPAGLARVLNMAGRELARF